MTNEDLRLLKKLAKTMTTLQIASVLGRTKSCINRACRRLKIKTVTPPHLPNSGCFKTPPPGSERTRFKKGQPSNNTAKAEGHVTILKTGFAVVKSGGKWVALVNKNPELDEVVKLSRKLKRKINEQSNQSKGRAI